MEPPPLPPSSSARFRLRVQIYPPQDAYNLNAVPLRQFTIVKTSVLELPDLTLQELCDEVVKRFKAIYPGELLFAIDKPQDSYGSDLYLGDRVRDVFVDNEIFRVIKGATIRASVEPHRARSQSVQPNAEFQRGSIDIGKRKLGHSELEGSLRGQKRQMIATNDPDRPIRSNERETTEQGDDFPGGHVREPTIIQDSQETSVKGQSGRAISGLSHRENNTSRRNLSQARKSDSLERHYSNQAAVSSVPRQQFPTTPSLTSSKDEANTSDSDVHLPQLKRRPQSRRKLTLVDDFSEQDRGNSISTAVTTPQSLLQQPNNQSPGNDSRKLRRPTVRPGKHTTEDAQKTRPLPRQNVYEVIETDTEHPTANPVPRSISSKISDSYKWKLYQSSNTPGSDKSSPRSQRSAPIKQRSAESSTTNRSDHKEQQNLEVEQKRSTRLARQQVEQERSRLAFEAAEQCRLDAECEEKEREAKSKIERLAAERLQMEMEAKKAEAEKAEVERQAEAAKRAEAERKAEAARKFEEERVKEAERVAEAERAARLAEEARLEAETSAELEEKSRARLQAEEERARKVIQADKLRLELDSRKKAAEKNPSQDKATTMQLAQEKSKKIRNLRALEATVRRAASTPAIAVAAQEQPFATRVISEVEFVDSASRADTTTSTIKRSTCTPFIPQGRLSKLRAASTDRLYATVGSSPKLSSPNVGLEDQMPMPPQLKRQVSFADQVPPSESRNSGRSFPLKQTTLIPPRLDSNDIKSTPKRTILNTNSNSTKSSKAKGKAKVVESPGKPPTPTIEISSDEEDNSNSKGPVTPRSSVKGVTSQSFANYKGSTKQVTSSPNSQLYTDVIELDGIVGHNSSTKGPEVEDASHKNLDLSRKSVRSNAKSTSQFNEDVAFLDTSPYRVPSAEGPTNSQLTARISQYRNDSSKLSSEISQAARISPNAGYKQAKLVEVREEEQSVAIEEESEDDLDSIETPPALNAADALSRVPNGQSEAINPEEGYDEATDESEEEDDDDNELQHSQLSRIQALVPNQRDNQINIKKIMEDEVTDGALKANSDDGEESAQNESIDEEPDERSDGMQAQVDDQLLSRPFESPSSPKQQSSSSKPGSILLAVPKGRGLLQNHESGRPSLRRMNLEAQRTKRANLEAAKARGLEKAQKMQIGVMSDGLTEESSEDVSSSENNSSVSDFEMTEDVSTQENGRGNLTDGVIDEMGQQLLAESTGHGALLSAKPSALKVPSKEQNLLSRSIPKLHTNGDKRARDKSSKIGWAKLGKQFSASKRKSSSQL